jgi:hypothetical protein
MSRWMAIGFLLALGCGGAVRAGDVAAGSARVDALVNERLMEARVKPSEVCEDAVFLRRVYLDLTGSLPEPQEVRRFLKSRDTRKREKLIEELFERQEYADYWALKWSDLLRVKSEFPSNLWPNAVQAYHRWLWTAMRDNMRYDLFARSLLTSSGSNFREAPVNFYRALSKREPEAMAQASALLFMGVRPDGFTEAQWQGMGPFFARVGYKKTAEWKEEIVYNDPMKAVGDAGNSSGLIGRFPDGTEVVLRPDEDPRHVFADWLVDPANEWFSRSIVNRIWFWLLGRGLIHEPDDIRPDNPASHPALLDFLARELVESGYDLRHIYRIILNSKTYQRSSRHTRSNEKDEELFSRYYVRRLEAEVLIDAICKITGTQEEYSSAIPEPFTWIPAQQRSIALADGSITSPFLDLFGRPSRDTGYELERNNRLSSAQMLHLLNSSHIRKKLETNVCGLGRTLKKLDQQTKEEWEAKKKNPELELTPGRYGRVWRSEDPDLVVDQLYLSILSRYPTRAEREVVIAHLNTSWSAQANVADVAWALINSGEFLLKH